MKRGHVEDCGGLMPMFTKAPWLVDSTGGVRIYAPDPYGHGEMHIAEVRGWGHLIGTGACRFDNAKATAIQDANARVMGAGPLLYDAVRALLHEVSNGNSSNVRAARALLAEIDKEG